MDSDTAQYVIAWSSLAMALFTFVIVVTGIYQTFSVRRETSKNRTIGICNRYDTDPLLYKIIRRLRDAERTDEIIKNPNYFMSDVIAILNYLDSIAIGIKQKIYNEKMAKDHMIYILNHYVNKYIKNKEISDKYDIGCNDYVDLCNLYDKWNV